MTLTWLVMASSIAEAISWVSAPRCSLADSAARWNFAKSAAAFGPLSAVSRYVRADRRLGLNSLGRSDIRLKNKSLLAKRLHGAPALMPPGYGPEFGAWFAGIARS
jgi:hypothetical protein